MTGEDLFSIIAILISLIGAYVSLSTFFLKNRSENEYLSILKENKKMISKSINYSDNYDITLNEEDYDKVIPLMKEFARKIDEPSHRNSVLKSLSQSSRYGNLNYAEKVINKSFRL